jgi:hypothetical protein
MNTGTRSLPACRAERLAIREDLIRNAGNICRVQVHSVAPPLLDTVEADVPIVRVLKSKEDDDGTDSVTRIQGCRKYIYIPSASGIQG